MNWRRGLFRLWLVGSAVWILIAGWWAYQGYLLRQKAFAEQACFTARAADPNRVGNVFDCFTGGPHTYADLTPFTNFISHHGMIAFAPVVAALALLMASNWIVAGFNRPTV